MEINTLKWNWFPTKKPTNKNFGREHFLWIILKYYNKRIQLINIKRGLVN